MELNGMGKKLMNKNIIYEIKEGRGFIKEFVLSEGFYINGQLNGKGKKYNIVGQLVFEGEYLNGKKHGIGKEYRYGILRFEGEYLYNYKRKGKQYYPDDKLEFEGEFLYSKKWNGKGYYYNEDISYELVNGSGKIKEYDEENNKLQLIFEGEYLKGKKMENVKNIMVILKEITN